MDGALDFFQGSKKTVMKVGQLRNLQPIVGRAEPVQPYIGFRKFGIR
jgi:hypothetical protein